MVWGNLKERKKDRRVVRKEKSERERRIRKKKMKRLFKKKKKCLTSKGKWRSWKTELVRYLRLGVAFLTHHGGFSNPILIWFRLYSSPLYSESCFHHQLCLKPCCACLPRSSGKRHYHRGAGVWVLSLYVSLIGSLFLSISILSFSFDPSHKRPALKRAGYQKRNRLFFARENLQVSQDVPEQAMQHALTSGFQWFGKA